VYLAWTRSAAATNVGAFWMACTMTCAGSVQQQGTITWSRNLGNHAPIVLGTQQRRAGSQLEITSRDPIHDEPPASLHDLTRSRGPETAGVPAHPSGLSMRALSVGSERCVRDGTRHPRRKVSLTSQAECAECVAQEDPA
jgi:hypothetical protein